MFLFASHPPALMMPRNGVEHNIIQYNPITAIYLQAVQSFRLLQISDSGARNELLDSWYTSHRPLTLRRARVLTFQWSLNFPSPYGAGSQLMIGNRVGKHTKCEVFIRPEIGHNPIRSLTSCEGLWVRVHSLCTLTDRFRWSGYDHVPGDSACRVPIPKIHQRWMGIVLCRIRNHLSQTLICASIDAKLRVSLFFRWSWIRICLAKPDPCNGGSISIDFALCSYYFRDWFSLLEITFDPSAPFLWVFTQSLRKPVCPVSVPPALIPLA